jgi:hypothetical protein
MISRVQIGHQTIMHFHVFYVFLFVPSLPFNRNRIDYYKVDGLFDSKHGDLPAPQGKGAIEEFPSSFTILTIEHGAQYRLIICHHVGFPGTF